MVLSVNNVDKYALNFSTANTLQISFNTTQLPTIFSIQTYGSITVKGPSLLLRNKVVGCQECLKDYWCAQATTNSCPSNLGSAVKSSLQTDCYCVPGYYGKVGSTVGYTPCTICPMNYFCPGENNLTVCPNGTMTTSTGSTS